MKKTIHLLVLLIAFGITSAAAQSHHPMNKEQFRKAQQDYLTEKVQLTPNEAKKFFPLYFELQDKKHDMNKEAWHKLHKGQKGNLTESEYSKLVEDIIEVRIATDKLELEYVQMYKKFLSSKKIYKLQRAEMSFRRNILKKAQNSAFKNKRNATMRK